MQALLKPFGWLLLLPGVLLLLLAPYAALTDGADAVAGLIIMAGMFGIPGGVLLRTGITKERETERQTQLLGFVRSHDAFTLQELATHIGMTPAQAQTLLNQNIAQFQVPLVMHRSTNRYLRLDRLSQSAQIAEHCQACGGALGSQIVFEGESLTCPYCNCRVETHAPAQPGPGAQYSPMPRYSPPAPQYSPPAPHGQPPQYRHPPQYQHPSQTGQRGQGGWG